MDFSSFGLFCLEETERGGRWVGGGGGGGGGGEGGWVGVVGGVCLGACRGHLSVLLYTLYHEGDTCSQGVGQTVP